MPWALTLDGHGGDATPGTLLRRTQQILPAAPGTFDEVRRREPPGGGGLLEDRREELTVAQSDEEDPGMEPIDADLNITPQIPSHSTTQHQRSTSQPLYFS